LTTLKKGSHKIQMGIIICHKKKMIPIMLRKIYKQLSESQIFFTRW
jgi:hypothetical protein